MYDLGLLFMSLSAASRCHYHYNSVIYIHHTAKWIIWMPTITYTCGLFENPNLHVFCCQWWHNLVFHWNCGLWGSQSVHVLCCQCWQFDVPVIAVDLNKLSFLCTPPSMLTEFGFPLQPWIVKFRTGITGNRVTTHAAWGPRRGGERLRDQLKMAADHVQFYEKKGPVLEQTTRSVYSKVWSIKEKNSEVGPLMVL